jgi:hypothetical protein
MVERSQTVAGRNPAEPHAEHRSNGFGVSAVRPFLLSGGLALIWFVEFQVDMEGDIPIWGVAAVVAMRLLADFVGAWLALSIFRLVFATGRLGWLRLRGRW